MISNWLSKGAQVISNGAKTISHAGHHSVDSQAMLKQLLNKLQSRVSKQLGQSVQGSLSTFNSQVIQENQMEKSIIQIKQKYNNLVSQVELQRQNTKMVMQNIIQFLKKLGESLKNTDMLAPLKQLQSAFFSSNVTKSEKQLKYFGKLYEAALQDHAKDIASQKQSQHRDEIMLLKNLNKNLQVELFRSRNSYSDLEKRLSQTHCKNQQMSQKLSILQKLGAQNAILSMNKQKQRFDKRQTQLLQRIKQLQGQKLKLQKRTRQTQNQITKMHSSIQLLRKNNDNISEDLKRQLNKKQQYIQGIMSKNYSEKAVLQSKVSQLTDQLQRKSTQLTAVKAKQSNQKLQNKYTNDSKELKQKIKNLQQQISKNNIQKLSLVSKEMMKILFTSFEDQSKEWSVKKDIRNQIYLLLDIKPKENQNKVQVKKWLGIF